MRCDMKWMPYILRHCEGIQSGSGIHTYFEWLCKNWIVFFHKSHYSSLCEFLTASCCHSIHLSFGCHKAYYCFWHDKLIPSQERRRFSQYIYIQTHTRFLLFHFYYYYLNQRHADICSFCWTEEEQQQQQKYSYLLRPLFYLIKFSLFSFDHISITWKF